MGEPARFLAPGAGTVEVTSPGRYVVWHEYRSTFENRTYRAEPALPDGVRFTILAPDGASLRLDRGGSQSWSDGETERRAVGQFQARTAGRHSVVVEGSFPPRVIAVAPDFLRRMVATIGGAIALVLLGVGGGTGLAVVAFGRRADAERAAAAAPGIPAFAGTVFAATAPAGTAPPLPSDAERGLREMVTLVYALQAASIVVGVTLIGGVIIDYLKRDEAAGTWLESHIHWQIRTFWWTLAWTVIGFVTFIVLIGIVILAAAAIWFIYRVAKGWVELRAGRPVGVR